MDSLRKSGDSCGARIRVVAQGMPVGLGQPIYDRLDADIAYAMMGLNAVKGIEIGAGFASVAQRGSTHGDSLSPQGFVQNNAGGVLGGISTGQDLDVSIAIKPTSSILTPRDTINSAGEAAQVQTKGRHDPLCRHTRDTHCRGFVGAGRHGPCIAPPSAMRGCGDAAAAYPCQAQRLTA